MYSFEERDIFLNKIMEKIELSNNIIGTYLIGSSSIGFNDKQKGTHPNCILKNFFS